VSTLSHPYAAFPVPSKQDAKEADGKEENREDAEHVRARVHKVERSRLGVGTGAVKYRGANEKTPLDASR
jgi:hypothetical protein